MMMEKVRNEIKWEQRVPIFKDSLILKQLGFAIGIPFGVLTVFLMLIKAYFGLIIVGATFVFAYFLVLLIFRGTYDVKYELNEKGVSCQNQNSQRKKVQTLSLIVLFIGIIKGNPTTAGAGMLSGARTNIYVHWKNIRKVKYNNKRKTIMIYAGFAENIALFCTDENYNEVCEFVKNRKGEVK